MATRRTGQTGKVSVTVTADDLKLLRARAKRLYRGNLSAAIADGVSRLREEEATHRLLQRLGSSPLSDARYAEIVREWQGQPPVKASDSRRKRTV